MGQLWLFAKRWSYQRHCACPRIPGRYVGCGRITESCESGRAQLCRSDRLWPPTSSVNWPRLAHPPLHGRSPVPMAWVDERRGVHPMNAEVSALLLAWIAILILSLAVAGLRRQMQLLPASRERIGSMGPVGGAPAPGLHDDLAANPGTKLLLFVNSTCPPCQTVLEEADLLAATADQLLFFAVFEGTSNGYRSNRVHVIGDAASAFSDFNIPVRPFAVVVDPLGRVVKSTPIGSREALGRIVSEARLSAAAVRGKDEPAA
jgi:thiol-disulfide isomerase/thioredoxin